MKFIEPQSMNFSQKVSASYKDFMQTHGPQILKPTQVEDECEDMLFQLPQAVARVKEHLKPSLEMPELLKRFTKEAKAYVRQHPLANKQKEEYSMQMSEAITLSGSNADEERTMKRKLSPKSS